MAASVSPHFAPRVSWASGQGDAEAKSPAVSPLGFTSLFVAVAPPAPLKAKRVFFSGQTSTWLFTAGEMKTKRKRNGCRKTFMSQREPWSKLDAEKDANVRK